MSALGETFRTAREAQGLTLTDITDRTHIRSVYLAAIEAEDWSAIGPAVYARGFVRTYARVLGLDPDAAVASYTAIGPASTPVLAVSPRNEPPLPGRSRAESRKFGLSPWAIAGLLVALALVAFVGYEYIDYQRHAAVAVDAPSPTPVAPPPVQALKPVPPTSVAVPRASEFALRLRDNSWLKVTVDGKVVLLGVFPKGTDRTYSGHAATIRAGNAGGVEVVVNGRNLGPLGNLGDVAERSFQL